MSSNGQARFDLLLREGRINSMVTRNRIITGPMERNLANRDGSLTEPRTSTTSPSVPAAERA